MVDDHRRGGRGGRGPGQPIGRDRLAAFLRSAGRALEGCRVGGFAYDAGVVGDPDLRAGLDSTFTELGALVEEAVRAGQEDGSLIPGPDPAKTAAALIAAVEGAFVLTRATGRQGSADAATSGILALLTND
ncbi:TetR family transcriptional regulator C-terminal domain-containing protein [Actinosynnema mirum]|uniref:TetR family transcriptional regulator C-terminal domain-containing protein n=1 Tax=Actinosynnema mirum TaxID=40567 RepID=UPI0016519FD8|nr:TetR family transcriptional regulator C-terminal domain-containing protein [Actinosynnema mirum]